MGLTGTVQYGLLYGQGAGGIGRADKETSIVSHFFKWMTENTDTLFWNDSVLSQELALGLERGATGVTDNPAIGMRCLRSAPDVWNERIRGLKKQFPNARPEELALKALNLTAQDAAKQVRSIYEATGGRQGYVAGQVNPLQMDEAAPMLEQAIEATAMEPNMGVKIPATEAGMEVIEKMAGRGAVTISTVSFSTAQAIAAQEAYERGRKRSARKNDLAFNYSVMIIGRLDEYLLAKAQRENLDISPSDVNLAGLAVTKRINAVLKERGYPGMCLTGGTRTRHVTQLAGARMCMTIGMAAQQEVLDIDPEQRSLGHEPVPEETIERLRAVFPEFSQALDEDGLPPSEFTSFGPCREMHDWFIDEFRQMMDFVKSA
jgi:transaldolase